MIDRPTRGSLLLAAAMAISACTGGASPSSPVESSPPTPSPTASPSAPAASPSSTEPAAGASATASPSLAPVLSQPWATATLTDVRTGQAFRIADLVAAGKVVFAEPMAIWCSKCKDQQRAAREALGQLDPDKVAWVGIDVELSESAENLARYAELNDFPFTYAVSSVELSRALAAEFGDVVLSPPSVNVIVVGTDGTVEHMTGHHDPDELVAIATAAGG